MIGLIGRRLALALALVAAASALTFVLVAAAPGNVAALLAERQAGAGATGELIKKIEEDLGLNQPIHVRYMNWLGKALRGDLGTSLRTNRPIAQEFADRIPVTAGLLVGGGFIALVLSLSLGIAGAVSNGGIADAATRAFALIGASTPNFFVAALLVLLFAVELGWFPSFGFGGPSSWVLPSITIALFPACVLSRVVRVNLQETMAMPFATTGFAKGLTRRGVLVQEALPTIAVPFLTTFGAQFSLMVIGAIVVETVFAWRGIGSFFVEVIRFRDFPAMQATLILLVVFFVTVNFLFDILSLFIDPRIRRKVA